MFGTGAFPVGSAAASSSGPGPTSGWPGRAPSLPAGCRGAGPTDAAATVTSDVALQAPDDRGPRRLRGRRVHPGAPPIPPLPGRRSVRLDLRPDRRHHRRHPSLADLGRASGGRHLARRTPHPGDRHRRPWSRPSTCPWSPPGCPTGGWPGSPPAPRRCRPSLAGLGPGRGRPEHGGQAPAPVGAGHRRPIARLSGPYGDRPRPGRRAAAGGAHPPCRTGGVSDRGRGGSYRRWLHRRPAGVAPTGSPPCTTAAWRAPGRRSGSTSSSRTRQRHHRLQDLLRPHQHRHRRDGRRGCRHGGPVGRGGPRHRGRGRPGPRAPPSPCTTGRQSGIGSHRHLRPDGHRRHGQGHHHQLGHCASRRWPRRGTSRPPSPPSSPRRPPRARRWWRPRGTRGRPTATTSAPPRPTPPTR